MTESRLCKSCGNYEGCPLGKASKAVGSILSCSFHKEKEVDTVGPACQAIGVVFRAERGEKTGRATIPSTFSALYGMSAAELEASLASSSGATLREGYNTLPGELLQSQQREKVLAAELMDAIQAHEEDTGALRKELALVRGSHDEEVARLARKRKKWKDAAAQLALEHNQLIEDKERLFEQVARLQSTAPPVFVAEQHIAHLCQERARADNAALGFKEEAKRNKEAEIVALEMLGASRKKLKEAKTRLGVSRCITAAVVILAVVYHYFIRG